MAFLRAAGQAPWYRGLDGELFTKVCAVLLIPPPRLPLLFPRSVLRFRRVERQRPAIPFLFQSLSPPLAGVPTSLSFIASAVVVFVKCSPSLRPVYPRLIGIPVTIGIFPFIFSSGPSMSRRTSPLFFQVFWSFRLPR